MTINQLIELNHPKVNILLDKYFNKNETEFKKNDYVFDIVNKVYRKIEDVIIVKVNDQISTLKIHCYDDFAVYNSDYFISVSYNEKNILRKNNLNFVTLKDYLILKEEYDINLPF